MLDQSKIKRLLEQTIKTSTNTDQETHLKQGKIALLNLVNSVKQDFTDDSKAQAWMNTGFKIAQSNELKELLWKHLSKPNDGLERAKSKNLVAFVSEMNRNRTHANQLMGDYAGCEAYISDVAIADNQIEDRKKW